MKSEGENENDYCTTERYCPHHQQREGQRKGERKMENIIIPAISACLAAISVLVFRGATLLFSFSDINPETNRRFIALGVSLFFIFIVALKERTQRRYHAVPKGSEFVIVLLTIIGMAAFCIALI